MTVQARRRPTRSEPGRLPCRTDRVDQRGTERGGLVGAVGQRLGCSDQGAGGGVLGSGAESAREVRVDLCGEVLGVQWRGEVRVRLPR